MSRAILLILLVPVAGGCASTTVKQNPGPHDHGFRFYRPKPYLLIKPAPATDTKDTSEFVSIEWTTLPDFSEQYSLHARAGLGTNATKVTLEQGWKVTKIDYSIDSKTDDNIKAIGSLIKSVGTFAAAGNPNAGESGKKIITAHLPARNVPLGLYEAVINRDPNGAKQLYGWRYVGFGPFAPCPVDPSGVQSENCAVGNVYGLVDEGGVMVFKLLDDVRREEIVPVYIPAPGSPTTAAELKIAIDAAFVQLSATATQQLPSNPVRTIRVTNIDMNKRTVKLVVAAEKPDAKRQKPEQMTDTEERLKYSLQKTVLAQGLKDVKVAEVELTVAPPETKP